jgi:hypothetical protein
VTQPRRVLIDWDYAAYGIWQVLTREEKQGTVPPGRWSGTPLPERHERPRPWRDRLSSGLLDDLQAWNDACTAAGHRNPSRHRNPSPQRNPGRHRNPGPQRNPGRRRSRSRR